MDELLAPPPWSDAPPLFLLGSARSGTTLGYQILAQAFHVTFLPRAVNLAPGLTHTCFRMFSQRLREPPGNLQSNRGRTKGLLGPAEAIGFWTPWVDEQGPRVNALARDEIALANAVHRLQGHLRAPLLTKCLYLVHATDLLARAFPNARFIHLSRSPVPAIASLYTIRRGISPAWWSVRPPGAERVSSLPLLDQCVWQHFAVEALVREALAAIGPARSRILVYEQLCSNPQAEMETICQWVTPAGWQAREDWQPPALSPSEQVEPELEQRIRTSPEFRHA
ncbi:MAG: sulfotransferase [Xanthomonadales bacterium]|nr:sulfotransferase [Xanthomonadales bacterium]